MQLKRLEINIYTINKRTYIDRIIIKYTHVYKIFATIQKSWRLCIFNNPIFVDRFFIFFI